jgi:hypothetical protein
VGKAGGSRRLADAAPGGCSPGAGADPENGVLISCRFTPGSRGVGEADAELVDAVERGVNAVRMSKSQVARSGPGRGEDCRGRKFRCDTRMIDRQEPAP